VRVRAAPSVGSLFRRSKMSNVAWSKLIWMLDRRILCLDGSAAADQGSKLRRQDFSSDSKWEAVNNRPMIPCPMTVHDFGHRRTHFAGGKAIGEIGGVTQRSKAKAYYAKRRPTAKALEDRMSAFGVFAVESSDSSTGAGGGASR
jgi:hypothetical protein